MASPVRSALLRIKVTLAGSGRCSRNSGHKAKGSTASGAVASTTSNTRSASLIALSARSTPIFSTWSSVSRRPAVSTTCSGIPSMWICSRKISRVVPAISVTMAASRPARALSRLDLPALGRPAITTVIPSRSKAPCPASRSTVDNSSRTLSSIANTWPSARKSISSSGKSIAAST